MKSNCRIDRRTSAAALCLGIISVCGGCQEMAILWANIQGGETIDAEFTLTKQPLLILIDDREGLVTQPRALRELHATIAENFIKFDVNNRVIPARELQRLRQKSERKYDRMTIREVGEKLGADQVLYVRIKRFTVAAEPGAPLFKGEFAARVKVISTARQSDVRLWPSEQSGRLCSASTNPRAMDGEKTAADIGAELGIRLGQEIAGLFFEHREFADR
ncbi:MAG: hypothetical protein ACE5E1_04175 [Phycisphaerae bacterium]